MIVDLELHQDVLFPDMAMEVFKNTVVWLVDQYAKMATEYWQMLPEKDRKSDYTKFLWIATPLREGFRNVATRKRFNTALYNATAARRTMSTIKLKAGWDNSSFQLVVNGQLTGEGLLKYWRAVDAGFIFWQNVMLSNVPRSGTNDQQQLSQRPARCSLKFQESESKTQWASLGRNMKQNENRFKWTKKFDKSQENGNRDRLRSVVIKKLPSPPPAES